MVVVRRRDSEGMESLIKRFRRKVSRASTMAELRRRAHYEKPSLRRHRRRQFRERVDRERRGG